MGPASALKTVSIALVAALGLAAGESAAPEGQTPVSGTPDKPAQDAPAKPARPALPPRVAVGGVRLLETTSTIVFPGRETAPHELVATFAFPARARLALQAQDAQGVSARELRYRFGADVYSASGERASTVLADGPRLDVLADLELRTALFLWPDGAEWKGEGLVREAARGELGALRARLARADAPPTELELVDAEGRVVVAFRAVTWVEERGRRWPATFEAWRAGALAFRETVRVRDTTRTYVDSYFLPADRRGSELERERVFGRVRDAELPRCASRRVELPSGLAWSALRPELERITRTWTETLKPAGLALDPNGTIELGPAGEPRAVLVRLATEPATLPEGFEWIAARSGRVVALEGLESLAGLELERLREGLPEKARVGTPYVRLPAKSGGVLVVLPWTRAE